MANNSLSAPIMPSPPSMEMETKKYQIGYIVEHAYIGKALSYSKVLTENPEKGKGKERWIVILLHRPTIEYELGSVISFQFGRFQGKLTVENADLISAESPLTPLFKYVTNEDVQEASEAEEITLSHLAKQFMLHTHKGSGKEAVKQFLISQEIYTIIAVLGNRKVIIRPL